MQSMLQRTYLNGFFSLQSNGERYKKRRHLKLLLALKAVLDKNRRRMFWPLEDRLSVQELLLKRPQTTMFYRRGDATILTERQKTECNGAKDRVSHLIVILSKKYHFQRRKNAILLKIVNQLWE